MPALSRSKHVPLHSSLAQSLLMSPRQRSPPPTPPSISVPLLGLSCHHPTRQDASLCLYAYCLLLSLGPEPHEGLDSCSLLYPQHLEQQQTSLNTGVNKLTCGLWRNIITLASSRPSDAGGDGGGGWGDRRSLPYLSRHSRIRPCQGTRHTLSEGRKEQSTQLGSGGRVRGGVAGFCHHPNGIG